MAKLPPVLEQSEPLLKTIQRVYHEHLLRTKAMASVAARSDQAAAELSWALTCDEDGDTPLHIAVAKGDEAMTRRLLKCLAGGNVSCNIKNKLLQTPFHLTCITDNAPLAALFAESDASCLDVTDRHGNNGVHLAVKHSCKETGHATLRTVLKVSSPVALESKNIYGLAPMHLAAQLNNAPAIRLLRQAGADINVADNKGGASPIILATRGSRREAAQALLELGANPNLRTTYGETASQVASARSDRALSELLAFYDTPYDVSRQSAAAATSSHHPSSSTSTEKNDFESQTRSGMSQIARTIYPPPKPDIHAASFGLPQAPPSGGNGDMMTSSQHRSAASGDLFLPSAVKVERASPSRNPPPFPERSGQNRRQTNGALLKREVQKDRQLQQEKLQFQQQQQKIQQQQKLQQQQAAAAFLNHLHHQVPFLVPATELVPQCTTPRHSTLTPGSQATAGGKRKAPPPPPTRATRTPPLKQQQQQDQPLDLSVKRYKHAPMEREAPLPIAQHTPQQARRDHIVGASPVQPTSKLNASAPQPSRDKPQTNQHPPPPPPYPHLQSVIMSSPNAGEATGNLSSVNSRPRRYRSDDGYHESAAGGSILSDVEKQALDRRRSAPDGVKRAYSGRRQMDLHSYTGCLPPHYLHLLESSGNLPIRANHVLRDVSDIFGSSTSGAALPRFPGSSSSFPTSARGGEFPSGGSAVPTSVIVMSSSTSSSAKGAELGLALERRLADKGRSPHVTTGRHDVTTNDAPWPPTSSSSTSSSDGRRPRSELTEMTGGSSGFAPTEVRATNRDVTSDDVRPFSSSRRGFPELGMTHVASPSQRHSCPGCTAWRETADGSSSDRHSQQPKQQRFSLNAMEPFKKYVTASSASSPKLVFCSELGKREIVLKRIPVQQKQALAATDRQQHQEVSTPISTMETGVGAKTPTAAAVLKLGSAETSPAIQEARLLSALSSAERHSHAQLLCQPAFHKSSFSDTDCPDAASSSSDDSGTDVTYPSLDGVGGAKPREHARLVRKSSLDAKLEQWRARKLDQHQSHYERACAQDPAIASSSRDVNEQEDLLANSIEDSDSEDEGDKAVAACSKAARGVAPPADGFPKIMLVASVRPEQMETISAPRVSPSSGRVQRKTHRNLPARKLPSPVGVIPVMGNLQALHYSILQQQRLQREMFLHHHHRSMIPPRLLFSDPRKRRARPPGKIQIFPPTASRLSGAKEHQADDLEMGDLEISDEEECQSSSNLHPAGLTNTHLVYG